jgi:hypothetical protein
MRRNLAVATALLLSLASAFAQTQVPVPPPAQQQPGGAGALGGAKPSPELKAARKAMRQACMQDIRALCTGTEPGGGKVMMCLRSHGEQVSDGCKAATRHLRDLRRGA